MFNESLYHKQRWETYFLKKKHVLRVSFYKHQFKISAENLSRPQNIDKEKLTISIPSKF